MSLYAMLASLNADLLYVALLEPGVPYVALGLAGYAREDIDAAVKAHKAVFSK